MSVVWRRWSVATALVLAIVASVAAGWLLVSHPRALVMVFGFPVCVGFAWLADRRPRGTLACSIVAVIVVPFLAAPRFSALLADPGLLALWGFACVMLARVVLSTGLPTISALDVAVVALCAAMLGAVISGSQSFTDLVALLWLWIGPYLAGRVCSSRLPVTQASRSIVLAAVVLAPFVAIEAASGSNLLTQVFHARAAVSAGLGTVATRLNEARAEGSFGQPIPLAMFLASTAILCWALSTAAAGWKRTTYIVGAAVLVMLQAFTLSRTGWLILAMCVAMLIMANGRAVMRTVSPWVVGVGVLALVVVLKYTATGTLLGGGGGGGAASAEVTGSSDYRGDLLKFMLSPGILHPFGTSVPFPGVDNNVSIDNAYLGMAYSWGIVAMIALAIIASLTLVAALRLRSDLVTLSVAVVAAGNLLALLGVAFLTQQQMYIWFLVGLTSGAWSDARVRNGALARGG